MASEEQQTPMPPPQIGEAEITALVNAAAAAYDRACRVAEVTERAYLAEHATLKGWSIAMRDLGRVRRAYEAALAVQANWTPCPEHETQRGVER